MKNNAEIDRSEKSITTWQNHLKKDRDIIEAKEKSYNDLQKKLKVHEQELADVESRIGKAAKRKDFLKSGREIEAHEAELIRLEGEKDELEFAVLDFLDRVEKSLSELEEIKKDLSLTEKQTESDVNGLNEKIVNLKAKISEIEIKFNELSDNLAPQYRSRFLKLLHSKDGIAISLLTGEICSHCNFQVPSSLATSVNKNRSVEICTNCGRFIYS